MKNMITNSISIIYIYYEKFKKLINSNNEKININLKLYQRFYMQNIFEEEKINN